MSAAKERQEFLSILQAALLPALPRRQVLEAGRLLLRHAKTHGDIAVAQCNGPGDYVNRVPYPEAGEIYRRHEEQCTKREARCERRITAICEGLGIRADFGGDPRGYTVKLHLPDGSYNTWGGRESGLGVPQ